MNFTVEEISMIRAMDHRNRRSTIADLRKSIPEIYDSELKELCQKTLVKIMSMTDGEFDAIDFSVYEEDEGNE